MSSETSPWLIWAKANPQQRNLLLAMGMFVLAAVAWVWQSQSPPPTATNTGLRSPSEGSSSTQVGSTEMRARTDAGGLSTEIAQGDGKLGQHTRQMYNNISVFESPAMLEKKRVQTLEQDLADGIRQMRNIDDASVTISERSVRDMQSRRKVSAMVMLKSKLGQPVADHCLAAIRTMVAGADVDLLPENVQIVDLTTGRNYDNNSGPTIQQQVWEQQERQRLQEEYWERKVRTVVQSLGEEFDLTVSVQERTEENSAQLTSGLVESTRPPGAWAAETIAVCIFLKRSAVELAKEPTRQNQYAQLRQTLQRMDSRMHVEIFAVRRNDDPLMLWKSWYSAGTQIPAAGWMTGAAAFVVLFLLLHWCFGARTPVAAVASPLRVVGEPVDDMPGPDENPEPREEEQDLIARVGTLVREDPDAAARVIKNWMRKAG